MSSLSTLECTGVGSATMDRITRQIKIQIGSTTQIVDYKDDASFPYPVFAGTDVVYNPIMPRSWKVGRVLVVGSTHYQMQQAATTDLGVYKFHLESKYTNPQSTKEGKVIVDTPKVTPSVGRMDVIYKEIIRQSRLEHTNIRNLNYVLLVDGCLIGSERSRRVSEAVQNAELEIRTRGIPCFSSQYQLQEPSARVTTTTPPHELLANILEAHIVLPSWSSGSGGNDGRPGSSILGVLSHKERFEALLSRGCSAALSAVMVAEAISGSSSSSSSSLNQERVIQNIWILGLHEAQLAPTQIRAILQFAAEWNDTAFSREDVVERKGGGGGRPKQGTLIIPVLCASALDIQTPDLMSASSYKPFSFPGERKLGRNPVDRKQVVSRKKETETLKSARACKKKTNKRDDVVDVTHDHDDAHHDADAGDAIPQ